MVYFLQEDSPDGFIKIGHTEVSSRARMKSARTYNARSLKTLATLPGDKTTEAELHKQFASLRERGEWFRPGSELLEFIRALPAHDASPIPLEETENPIRKKKLAKYREYEKICPNYYEELGRQAKQIVEEALERADGNVAQAAREIGLTDTGFRKILKRPVVEPATPEHAAFSAEITRHRRERD